MAQHGNANNNEAEHHLYEIRDREYKDVYKYGICGDPLLPDGSSPRGRLQTRELNRAVRWLRFFHQVLVSGIRGRVEARRLEDEYIAQYQQKNGVPPPGNDTAEDWAG